MCVCVCVYKYIVVVLICLSSVCKAGCMDEWMATSCIQSLIISIYLARSVDNVRTSFSVLLVGVTVIMHPISLSGVLCCPVLGMI